MSAKPPVTRRPVIPTVLPRTTPAPPLSIGERIRTAREQAGLSQRELAQIIGFSSAQAVSLWESEQREVSASVLWKIAHATGQPISFFFEG